MKDFKLSESIERWLSKQCHNNPWIILTVFQSYKLLLSFLFTHTHTHKISKDACWSQKPSNANRAAHCRHSWPQSGLEVGLWSVNGWAQVDVWRRKGIYRPNKFTKKKQPNVFLQEHHWDYRDFFFFYSFVPKELKMWLFKALIQERWQRDMKLQQYFEQISIQMQKAWLVCLF